MRTRLPPRSAPMVFNGTTQYLFIDYNVPVRSSEFTFSAWCRPDPAIAADGTIMSIGGTAGSFTSQLYYQHANTRLQSRNVGAANSSTANTTTASMTGGNWYHVVGIFGQTFNTCFINGADLNRSSLDVGALTQTRLAIGMRAGFNNQFFNGAIDQPCLIYGRADKGEISRVARGDHPFDVWSDRVIGAWLDGTGRDFSGQGRHLTPVATPTRTGLKSPARQFVDKRKAILAAAVVEAGPAPGASYDKYLLTLKA